MHLILFVVFLLPTSARYLLYIYSFILGFLLFFYPNLLVNNPLYHNLPSITVSFRGHFLNYTSRSLKRSHKVHNNNNAAFIHKFSIEDITYKRDFLSVLNFKKNDKSRLMRIFHRI